jgi:hypothetical protein
MKKLRFQRPRLSTMSPTPTCFNLANTVETYNEVVAKLPARVERGRYLFLVTMAGFLRDRLRQRAPDVMLHGKERSYAEDLRLAVVSGAPDGMDMVAIYFDSETATLTEGEAEHTALYVLPHRTSPGWVNVLTKWGPWPAMLLPVTVGKQHAKVISRRARPDELRELTARLGRRQAEILRELQDAGADNPRMERTVYGVGTEVRQDIAHAVLRREFGLDGAAPRAHWRPALRETVEAVPDAMARFNRYLVTGRENAFLLPEIDDQITMSQLQGGASFMGEIAPFVPKR